MQAVRALYDGIRLRALSSEPLPQVEQEMQVIVIFDTSPPTKSDALRLQRQEALARLRAARTQMPFMQDNLREMIEDGRNH